MKRSVAWIVEALLPPLAFFALVVAAWQEATMFWDLPAYLVPAPGAWPTPRANMPASWRPRSG